MPLVLVVEAGGGDDLASIVRIGAGIAAFGVLLTLIPGVSRTALAMARRLEPPLRGTPVSTPRRVIPLRAELTLALILVVLTATVDVRGDPGFSGVTVLSYYADPRTRPCRTLLPGQRRWPRLLAVTGLIGCLTLIVTLPTAAIIAGALVLAVGLVVHRAIAATAHGRSGRSLSR